MEVIRVEKNKNYTTISNVFLKDLNLSLKTKGFLAMVMALPDDWKFTVGGMAAICKEGKTAIYTALKELIQVGYAKRTYLYGDVKKDGVIMRLRTGVSYSISETPIYLDLDNINQDTLNQDNLNLGKLNDNNKVTTKSSTKSNKVKSKLSKDSVVTDTPPLATNLSSSEIPNNCQKEKTGKLENVKTETLQKKANSGGGGGENSQSDVGNSNKPKKQPIQRLNLATLTTDQIEQINAVLRRYDDENAAKLAWLEWLEYKSKAGGKIKQYKDHTTALKALELASKQAQFQSEALTDAVNNSIANEYQGIFPENFVKKSYQYGTTNGKKDRATANNDYLEALRNGIGFPDWGNQSQV